jgi:hypothetical protein
MSLLAAMDTRELIYLILKVVCSVVIWAGILYSLYVGVRYGFHFPRFLHIMAIVIVILEAGVLVVFPLPLSSITAILGSFLALLPVAPYIGWVVAGGPARLNELYGQPVRRRSAPNGGAAGPLGS